MNAILTVDKAGRVVLPKPLRDQLQLNAGDSLHLESADGEIRLRPVRGTAQMRRKEGIWVFRTGQPVSAAAVDETIRQLREGRGDSASRLDVAGPAAAKKAKRPKHGTSR